MVLMISLNLGPNISHTSLGIIEYPDGRRFHFLFLTLHKTHEQARCVWSYICRMPGLDYIYIYTHTEPRTASSATLSLSTESHACIPVQSRQARLQTHAAEVLTQNEQVYSTWPSVGKDNPGRKLEPLDLASTPRDARYAMKLPRHKPTLSSLYICTTSQKAFGGW
jgi:hypothetical protein